MPQVDVYWKFVMAASIVFAALSLLRSRYFSKPPEAVKGKVQEGERLLSPAVWAGQSIGVCWSAGQQAPVSRGAIDGPINFVCFDKSAPEPKPMPMLTYTAKEAPVGITTDTCDVYLVAAAKD